jgi:hypothetical protein
MENSEGLARIFFIGVLAFLAVVMAGLGTVWVNTQLEKQAPKEVNTAPLVQVVDKACAVQLEALSTQISALHSELEVLSKEAAALDDRKARVVGTPVIKPEELPAYQTPEGFTSAVGRIDEANEKMQMVGTDCQEYPCIVVFGAARDFRSGSSVRRAFEREGFSWRQAWKRSGKALADGEDRHYMALRFFPKKDVTPDQERFLFTGAERALERAMKPKKGTTSP